MGGSGTLRVAGSRPFTCRARASGTCRHTFHVRRGRRIVIKASPLAGWKLTRWLGACKGSAPTCSLKLKAGRSAAVVTFVPPGDRLNPYRPGTAAKVNDGLGNWSMRILSTSEQGNDLIVRVQATLAQSVPNSWTLGLDYATFLKLKDRSPAVASDQCLPPDPNFLFVGTDVPPWGPGYVQGGQTVTGNLCFSYGPDTPEMLFVAPPTNFPPAAWLDLVPNEPPSPPPRGSVWFALR